MTGYPTIDAILSDIDDLVKLATGRAAELPPCPERELLSASVKRLREMREGADAQVAGAINWLKAAGEGQMARLTQAQAKLASVRADMAAADASVARDAADAQAARAAAAAQAAAATPAELDPELGGRLRDELLARFVPAADGPTAEPRKGRDVWENWE